MSSWATRAIFVLAMLAPIVVGLWLYSFVFASPFGVLLATVPPAVTPTAARTSGNEAPTTTGAQLPQPTSSPTAPAQQPDSAAKQPPTPTPAASDAKEPLTPTPPPSAAEEPPSEASTVPTITPTSLPVL